MPPLHAPMLLALLTSCRAPVDDTAADTAADTDTGPEVEVVVTLQPEAPVTADTLSASVTGADDVLSLDFAWYRDNALVSGLGGALVSSDQTAKGETWRVIVTPAWADGLSQPVSVTITIGNTPPAVDSVSIEGEVSVETDALVSAVASDPDGDHVELSYTWTVDGGAVEGWTGASLPAGSAARGQVIGVTATPDDGADVGTPGSAEATVGNAAPSLASASVGVDVARPTDTLEVTVEGWYDPDGDAEALFYAWFVNGLVIDGATEASFSLLDLSAETIVYCEVTPWDGIDEGDPVTTEIVVVGF